MKGITPVVSVVLLITLAVISAMGVYWWISIYVSETDHPTTLATISVEVIPPCATTGNTTVMIENTSPPGKKVAMGVLETSWAGGLAANDSTSTDTCPPETLNSGEKTSCVLINFHAGDRTVAIYGTNVASQSTAC